MPLKLLVDIIIRDRTYIRRNIGALYMKKNRYNLCYCLKGAEFRLSKKVQLIHQLQNMNCSDFNEDPSGDIIITALDRLTTIINIPMRNTFHSVKYKLQRRKY